jgi:hypothetical protein
MSDKPSVRLRDRIYEKQKKKTTPIVSKPTSDLGTQQNFAPPQKEVQPSIQQEHLEAASKNLVKSGY